MAEQKKSPDIAASIFFTFGLMFVFIFAVVCVNYLTKDFIINKQLQKEYEIITGVIDTEFDNNPLLEKTIITSADGKEKMELYPARFGGVVTSVVIKVSNVKGYGGYMELVVGFLMDGTISGYYIITHNETAGLGDRVVEQEFMDQFKWFNPEQQSFKVKKDGGDIDAVTGATISSRAVIDSIQKAHDAYKKFIMGE